MPERASAFAAHDWVERLIRPLPAGGGILDLGCGGGEPIARFLIDQGFAVTGIDLAQSQISPASAFRATRGSAPTCAPSRWTGSSMR